MMAMSMIGFALWFQVRGEQKFGAPPYFADAPERYHTQEDEYANWVRPTGPLKVGLQVGHWKTQEMPDELARIRDSGGGTSNGVVAEWEVALKIATLTKARLEKEGVHVDLLPATVPPEYWADAFVSIHADGSLNPTTSGYKVAAPRRDMSGMSDELADILEETYGEVTNLPLDPNITRNMTGYYAFSARRFRHAIHPMTAAAIVETGFLTNPIEAQMLIHNPELPARALTEGLMRYLRTVEIG